MAIKHYNPVTPGQRKKSTLVNEEITKSTPEKSLLAKMNKRSGRNNQGKITVRHQGGGENRKYRSTLRYRLEICKTGIRSSSAS